ncbi:nucleoporin Npp106 [Schizosaccharomyces japonicus yFS275]|uniref:Nuclear pore protein n=1 Tax=Schizosaccharomyces japonicus (strain yFS275 / FY16936) TaxID=402676 RepID=B6JZZ6_SCHJY|nr:nucleoporin Npp106 [Schizosaccharomyces japonicus yFS275]EEB06146.1 nucleoporin Npp106 [Schizosaccharomyces japonicus yFS275]
MSTAQKDGGETHDAAASTSQHSVLFDLLQKSRQLFQVLIKPQVPPIEYGLNQLEAHAHKMVEKMLPMRDGDAKAHYLLAESGMNAEQTRQKITSIHLGPLSEQYELDKKTIIEHPVKRYKEQNITASIENGLNKSLADFEKNLVQSSGREWEKLKSDFMCDIGRLLQGKEDSMLGASMSLSFRGSVSKSVNGAGSFFSSTVRSRTAGSYAGLSFLRTTELQTAHDVSSRFAGTIPSYTVQAKLDALYSVIHIMNEHRISGGNSPLFSLFSSVAQKFDSATPQLYDAWMLLARIVGTHPVAAEYVPAGVYAANKSAPHNSSLAAELRLRIVQGSLSYLQNQFLTVVHQQIGNTVPLNSDTFKKIHAFARARFFKNNAWTNTNLTIVNDVPIWAILYYMLRAGLLEDAMDFVRNWGTEFEKQAHSFSAYFNAFVHAPTEPLPQKLAERLQTEFSQLLRYAPEDPFKHAIYKILGQCEPNRSTLPDVCITTEDYMWIQLMLCRESKNASAVGTTGAFDLVAFQKKIVSFGARHFNPKNNNPFHYFLVLLLSGQFERAIHYLHGFFPAEAVHFAIVLAYYGLLSTCNFEKSESLLNEERDDLVRLNYPLLLLSYLNYKCPSETLECLDYLSCISLIPSYKSYCLKLVKLLILHSCDFGRLLGDVHCDGSHSSGYLEVYHRIIPFDEDFLKKVYAEGATEADNDGRYGDSVLLYHLLGDYDTVLSVAARKLGEDILAKGLWASSYSQPDSLVGLSVVIAADEAPDVLVQQLYQRYAESTDENVKISDKTRILCKQLLSIVAAKQAFEQERYKDCLRILEEVDVVPIMCPSDPSTQTQLSALLRHRAMELGTVPVPIVRVLPVVLLMAMSCLVTLFKQLRDITVADVHDLSSEFWQLRQKASSLVMFGTMIENYLSPSVIETLQTSQVSMN